MRLTVVAAGDPENVRTWSGTPFHMLRALRGEFATITVIRDPFPARYRQLRDSTYRLSFGRVNLDWVRWIMPLVAAPALQQITESKPDFVLSIANTPIGAIIARRHPTVHISDATFATMKNYYSAFEKMPNILKILGEEADRQLVLNARASLFSSNWAAASAICDYGASPQRVHVVPWGCNLDQAKPASFGSWIEPNECCSIVFIGMDWIRKGGDIAVATTECLRANGINAHLHVIGAVPVGAMNSDAVTFHGVLHKDNPDNLIRLNDLLNGAAFLLLPTRQDCTPMVISEVNAYGIPVIVTLTGGVGSIVSEGINGHCLSEAAKPEDYAKLLSRLWSDPPSYHALRRSARAYQRTVLDWGIWARQARRIIEAA